MRTIRKPVHIVETINKITKATMELLQETGKVSKEPISLETPIGEEDSHLMDFIEDKVTLSPLDFAIQGGMKEKINRILCSLPLRGDKIIRKRYGIGEDIPHSLVEVGMGFGVSRERGIGWVVLYQDMKNGKLFNFWVNEHDVSHPTGCNPILIMDVFEHAFMIDYGL